MKTNFTLRMLCTLMSSTLFAFFLSSTVAYAAGNKHKVSIDDSGFPADTTFDVLFTAAGCAKAGISCGNTKSDFVCAKRNNVPVGKTVDYVFPVGTSARAAMVCGKGDVAGWDKSSYKHTHVCWTGKGEAYIDNTKLSNSHCSSVPD